MTHSHDEPPGYTLAAFTLRTRLPVLFFLCCLLISTLPACGGTASDQDSELASLQNFTQDSVHQYLGYFCTCYAELMTYPDQETCILDQSLAFPFSECDQQAFKQDEAASLAYLDCLQRNASQGSACLIACDPDLILQCHQTFETLDLDLCSETLPSSVQTSLLTCARQRQAQRPSSKNQTSKTP